VSKFTQKLEKKQKQETSQARFFRIFLEELGYQAGQYEMLAHLFTVDIPAEISETAREIIKSTKKHQKLAKKYANEVEDSYKELEKAKIKYQRSFVDWEDAKDDLMKVEKEGLVSRKDIVKLKGICDSRNLQFEDYRGLYASQLMKTNKSQTHYYHENLPSVINSLESDEKNRIKYLKDMFGRCLAAEVDAAHIMDKCRETIKAAVDNIHANEDCKIVIESLKTGNMPPPDLPFEDIACRNDVKVGTLRKSKSLVKLKDCSDEERLFQKKQHLEEEFKEMEAKIMKGTKEIESLQMMVDTYSNNPSFGTTENIQKELDLATQNVQQLKPKLLVIDSQLTEVVERLNLKTASSPRYVNTKDQLQHSDFADTREVNSSPCETVSSKSRHKGVAKYDFDGDSIENSITMKVGEEFCILEEDAEGWAKVLNENTDSMGFVPSSYLDIL